MRHNLSHLRVVSAATVGVIAILLVPGSLGAQFRGAVSTCIVDTAHELNATAVLRGEPVVATLTGKLMCAAEVLPAHVVIVLDGGTSMLGAPLDRAIDAAEMLLDRLDLTISPQISVGVVGFGDSGSYECRLTNDESRVRRCIRQVRSVGSGGSMVDDLGLGRANRVLRDAESRRTFAPGDRHVVLFSDGGAPTDCGAAERGAQRLRSDQAQVIAACASAGCDRACLGGVVDDGQDLIAWTRLPRSWLAGRRFGQGIHLVAPRLVVISGTLPVGTDIVPGSLVPPPYSVSADGRSFAWRFTQNLTRGVTVTLAIRPLLPGHRTPSIRAEAHVQDNLFRERDVAFPDPLLLVLDGVP